MNQSFQESVAVIGLQFSQIGETVHSLPSDDPSPERRFFRLTLPAGGSGPIGVSLRFPRWSPGVFVLMPGAVYYGNRFPAFSSVYPPMPAPRPAKDPDQSLQISEVPRLLAGAGESCLRQTSADPAFPAIGFFFPVEKIALWVLTPQACGGELYNFELEENADRTTASLRVTASPPPGAAAVAEILMVAVPCGSVQELFQTALPLRTVMLPPPCRRPDFPFSAAWEILEEKHNRENWMETGGYYAVGTDPVRRRHISQNWQMGWTGGMIVTQALLLRGGAVSQERALRNFDFVFPAGQAASGFFYGMGDGTQWVGDYFSDPAKPWHLVRKSADGLYFMLGSLLHLRASGRSHLIKESWNAGLRKCADAFVQLWDENRQFGQFLDHNTGEILVANSTSGGLVPAALVRAAEYFPDPANNYLRVAAESAGHFIGNDLRQGVTSGGPGDAMQCPDSESLAGLLESLVCLHAATGEERWLRAARDAAVQLASWVVPYDFRFPAGSTFENMDLRTCGTVLANVQNKHSAPGLCTHSGIALFTLYRATGESFFMDLLRDMAHALPQFLSRPDRLIPFKIPYCQPDDPAQTWLNPGWMNERVNLTQWGPDEYPGELFYCSCWPEVSLMLTVAELPGVYGRRDTRQIWCLDHVEAAWSKEGDLTVTNPTDFPATVQVRWDESLPGVSRKKTIYLPPRGSLILQKENS